MHQTFVRQCIYFFMTSRHFGEKLNNQRQKIIQDLIPLTLDISTKTFLFGDTSKSLKLIMIL